RMVDRRSASLDALRAFRDGFDFFGADADLAERADDVFLRFCSTARPPRTFPVRLAIATKSVFF
ncbi:MAG: hypothetical protein ACKVG0_13805, partial [Alphaproteobacteria bacterium]